MRNTLNIFLLSITLARAADVLPANLSSHVLITGKFAGWVTLLHEARGDRRSLFSGTFESHMGATSLWVRVRDFGTTATNLQGFITLSRPQPRTLQIDSISLSWSNRLYLSGRSARLEYGQIWYFGPFEYFDWHAGAPAPEGIFQLSILPGPDSDRDGYPDLEDPILLSPRLRIGVTPQGTLGILALPVTMHTPYSLWYSIDAHRWVRIGEQHTRTNSVVFSLPTPRVSTLFRVTSP